MINTVQENQEHLADFDSNFSSHNSQQPAKQVIHQLKWEDVCIKSVNHSEIEKMAFDITTSFLENCGFNDTNDATEKKRVELLNKETINNIKIILPEMSSKQSEMLSSYISSAVATLKEKQKYCRMLLTTAYLTKGKKSEEERRSFCEAMAKSAKLCIGGASGSLSILQSQLDGTSLDLVAYELAKNTQLSGTGVQVHAQATFAELYGDSSSDIFSNTFLRQVTYKDVRRIIEPIAFLDKKYYEDFVRKEFTRIINEENEKVDNEEDFVNNLTERIKKHRCLLMRYLEYDCYGEDEYCMKSSLFRATGEDLDRQVENIVKNNPLGSKEVEITDEQKDLILTALTLGKKYGNIPVWLNEKIYESQMQDEMLSLVPNMHLHEFMPSITTYKQSENPTLQNLIFSGVPIEEIEVALQDKKLSISYNDYDQRLELSDAFMSHPDADNILQIVLTYIENKNRRSPQNKSYIDWNSSLYSAMRFGLDNIFHDEKWLSLITSKLNDRKMSRLIDQLSPSQLLAAINAAKEDPNITEKLFITHALMTEKLLSLSTQTIESLRYDIFQSKSDLLIYILKQTSNSAEAYEIITGENILNKFAINGEYKDLMQSLNGISGLLNHKDMSRLVSHKDKDGMTLLATTARHMPKKFNKMWEFSKIWLKDSDIADIALQSIGKESKGNKLMDIVATYAPKSFPNFWSDATANLSSKQISELITKVDKNGNCLAITVAKNNPEFFKKTIMNEMKTHIKSIEALRKVFTLINSNGESVRHSCKMSLKDVNEYIEKASEEIAANNPKKPNNTFVSQFLNRMQEGPFHVFY